MSIEESSVLAGGGKGSPIVSRVERLSLRANFSWTFIGNTVFNATQWGLVIVLAKLGSPEMVGRYALAAAITAPVFMFGNLGLTTVLATDVQDTRAFGDYLGLRLLSSLLGLMFIAVLLGTGGFEAGVIAIVVLEGLAKFIESLSDVSYGLMQKQERLDLMARSLMLRGLFPLATIAVALYLSRNLAVAWVTQVIVWGGILLVYDLPNVRRWQPTRPRFDRRILMGLLWLALPLGIVAGLNSLNTQVPRYIMEHFGGERELGIFSAIASLGTVVSMITIALSRSALPRLAQLYAQRSLDQFVRLLFRLVGIGAVVGALGVAGAVLGGKPFLSLVYTEEYAAHTDVLIVVMASVGAVAALTFLGTAISAARKFTIAAVVHVAKVIVIGGTCWVLIPRWGALGAAWATLVGALVSASAFGFILWRTVQQARRNKS